MVMDRNGRRHKASGLPGAGRYERDMEAADDLDLDLYEPDGPWGSAEVVAEGIDDGWIGVTDGVGILSDDALGPDAPRGVEAVVAAVGRRDYRDAVDRLAAVRGWVEDECPNGPFSSDDDWETWKSHMALLRLQSAGLALRAAGRGDYDDAADLLMAGTGWNGGIDGDAPSRGLYEARLGRLAVMFAESASDRQCRRLAGGLGDGRAGTACGIIDDAFLDGPNADMAVYALAKSLAARIRHGGDAPSVDMRRLAERLARNGAVSDAYLADGDGCRVPVGDVLLTAGGAMEELRLRALMEEVMRSAADGRRGRSGGRIAHHGGKAES